MSIWLSFSSCILNGTRSLWLAICLLGLITAVVTSENTKWAVLIAGSNGWRDYSLQADVCHAYQILLKGGLKKENIIIIMYDDIARNPRNPRPNQIFNSFDGPDVYSGIVPDYWGRDVNADTLWYVLSGGALGVRPVRPGNVLNSGPTDTVFIFYSGHGSQGFLSMPQKPPISDMKFHHALVWLYRKRKYASMVVYIQACHSGSTFKGMDEDFQNMNIYMVTSANGTELSFAAYCPKYLPIPLFDVCLGSQFGVAWTEDWEMLATKYRSLDDQYENVKKSMLDNLIYSHPVQFGNMTISDFSISTFMGSSDPPSTPYTNDTGFEGWPMCREELTHLRNRIKLHEPGSPKYRDAKKDLDDAIAEIERENDNFARIANILLNNNTRSQLPQFNKTKNIKYSHFNNCYHSLMDIYMEYCGSITFYAPARRNEIDNMCDVRVTEFEMTQASIKICST